MTRGTIFITNHVMRKDICYGYWYSYQKEEEKEILRVYKEEEKVFEQEAQTGEAYEVLFKKGFPYITPMTPPRKDWEAIAWLLGFSKKERFCSYQIYLDVLKKRREECETASYVESILEGPNFEFVEYSLVDDNKHEYHNLACWVSEEVTKEEICHLIPEFTYPEQYVRKLLSERFGISKEEFDNALAVFC